MVTTHLAPYQETRHDARYAPLVHLASLARSFAWAFTRRGFRRFAEWITAMAINVEEHTVTQSVLALERPADWKAMESFAEYGAWHPDRVTRSLTRLIETAPGRLWHGYHISAVDDTKVHRGGPHVWGTCTFHEYTARCPNRATTVRPQLGRPGGLAAGAREARLVPAHLRAALLPQIAVAARPGSPAAVEFRTKCELAVDLIREQARCSRDVTWPSSTAASPSVASSGRWSCPKDGHPASSSSPGCGTMPVCAPCRRRSGPRASGGPSPNGASGWRRRGRGAAGPDRGTPGSLHLRPHAASPLEGGRLPVAGAGHEVPVKAIVARVEGYKKRFTLVTSAVELTGLQMVELFAARFRQEDGFRDLKQRLGWEECRAWTGPDRADQPGAVGDD